MQFWVGQQEALDQEEKKMYPSPSAADSQGRNDQAVFREF